MLTISASKYSNKNNRDVISIFIIEMIDFFQYKLANRHQTDELYAQPKLIHFYTPF